MRKSTSASGAPDNSSLSHFPAMTRTSWLGRAVRNRHRHAIEQAPRRWRGGRRDDSAKTCRKILISTQVPRPPLDFDACWLACLKRARARGDTRRGGFLDTCLEPCYPPPGDECRSLRLTYGIVLGKSWGLAADSAAVQARWAALSCDELVGDGVANKWRA